MTGVLTSFHYVFTLYAVKYFISWPERGSSGSLGKEKQRSRAGVSFAQPQCSETGLGLAIKPEEERQEIHD
jgi:hypothetical protein